MFITTRPQTKPTTLQPCRPHDAGGIRAPPGPHHSARHQGAALRRRAVGHPNRRSARVCPFSVIEPAIDALKTQHLCEIVGGSSLGAPSYRYRITPARPRARAHLSRDEHVHGHRARARHAVPPVHDGVSGRQPRLGLAGPGPGSVFAPGPEPARARPARARRQRAALALRLRAARQRQDRRVPGDRQPALRRDLDPARRWTWTATSSRCSTRSTTSRCRRPRTT